MQFASKLVSPMALRCWDEECVLFDPASGDTHLLSHSGAEILMQLQHGPASVIELVGMLGIEAATDGTSKLHSQLQSMLDNFMQLALVECQLS